MFDPKEPSLFMKAIIIVGVITGLTALFFLILFSACSLFGSNHEVNTVYNEWVVSLESLGGSIKEFEGSLEELNNAYIDLGESLEKLSESLKEEDVYFQELTDALKKGNTTLTETMDDALKTGSNQLKILEKSIEDTSSLADKIYGVSDSLADEIHGVSEETENNEESTDDDHEN